jgi:hypothetical protein
MAAGIVLGVVASGWLLLTDVRLTHAMDRFDAAALASAANAFPPDAVVADLVAQGWFMDAADDPSSLDRAVAWSQRAVDAEPDRPYLWQQLAVRQFLTGDLEGSRASIDRALALQPWHPASLNLLYAHSRETGDRAAAALASTRLCELGVGDCDLWARVIEGR